MKKQLLGLLLFLLITSTSVMAAGIIVKEPKYPVHWMPKYEVTKCIVKQNAYPNGTVFHTAYGIWGRSWYSGQVCFVPQTRNLVQKKKIVIPINNTNSTNTTNTTMTP
jgi:hypothetical protein